jgi:hypothetical protein
MKRAEIRSFVEGFLKRRGARLEEVGPDLLRASGFRSGDTGPAEERLLAFGTRTHRRHAESELVAIGSAWLDRLLAEAARAGRYAVAYHPAPEGKGRAPKLRGLPEITGREWGKPHPAYRPLFLFVYVAEYHTIDVPDDLELIPLDPMRGQVLSSPGSMLEAMRTGSARPPRGWPQLPALPSAADWVRSLEALDRRLQRRARRVKTAAALEIARETANIEAYYRQLIDEVRHPVGRGQPSPEEETRRVRALQLDWKRRVQEVSRFWEAYGDVRLSAVGVVMEPCWAIPLAPRRSGPAARKNAMPCVVADYSSGRIVEPLCSACGEKLVAGAGLLGKNLVCRKHLPSD